MKKFILSLILVLLITETKAQNILPDSWTKYCGWHGGQKPQWGGWVRGYAQNQLGRFLIDTTTSQIDTTKLNNVYQSLLTLDTTVDILQLDEGLESARDTANVVKWMEMIEADSGKFWKSIVYQQTLKLTGLSNSQKRVYWQIGNEISSHAYSQTIRYWKEGVNINGYDYDQFVIPYYVENYLAPTVEAIDSASKAVYNDIGMINICLGSITNAHNINAQQFLDSLLNYRIVGVNAPSLSDKYVYELIHIITIHYAMGTANTSDWLNNINWYKNWSGIGRIRGVWSTEEVGIRAATDNKGGFASSIATSRYLEWSINNQYNAQDVRTNYYGWNKGTTSSSVKTFNDTLFSMLGNVKLINVPNTATPFSLSQGNLEYHSFLSEDKEKGIVIAFPERSQSQNQATIQKVMLNHSSWGNITGAKVYTYGVNGINPVNVTINDFNDSTIIIFPNKEILDYYTGLLIYLQTSEITGVNDLFAQIPETFQLYQNYPNPFNPSTTIRFSLPQREYITLKVYDALGREVGALVNGELNPGEQVAVFDANRFPSGIYFYRLTARQFSQTRKAVLMR
ncbi:MAG: T9SS type A sorting domain-containing protein [Stygiobacter sp.]